MIETKIHPRILAAARRWAQANRSDPFALRTALSDARNGISTLSHAETGKPAYYDAKPQRIERKRAVGGKTTVWQDVEWVGMVRP